MKLSWSGHLPFLIFTILVSIYHLWGIDKVPFHPDESSVIYQSQDLELLFSAPRSLAWDKVSESDPSQTYRALNPPLPKYVIGLGRRLAGFGIASIVADWDWSLDWDQNLAAGAFPPPRMLRGARLASTLMLPLSMVFLYAAGNRLGGRPAGLAAAFLFGTHSLILLHGRRAMSEGTLAFGVSFAFWASLHADRRAWLAGLASALALSAKYSTAPLLMVGALGGLWFPPQSRPASWMRWRNLALYLIVLIAVVFALHPFLWSSPIQAGLRMIEARRILLSSQVLELGALMPGQIMDSAGERVAGLLIHLFITPPQFAEVGNYLAQTRASHLAYLGVPGHSLFRGLGGGGLMIGLTILGILGAGRAVLKGDIQRRRSLGLLASATLLETAGLLAAVPLPFQRFYLPLVPLVCLWAAAAIGHLPLEVGKRLRQAERRITLAEWTRR